jgi:exopolysaccharide production protein ExoQ
MRQCEPRSLPICAAPVAINPRGCGKMQTTAVWHEKVPALDIPTAGERLFAVIALTYFARAFAPITSGFEVGEYSVHAAAFGNPLDQVAGGAIYIISIWLLLRDGDAVRGSFASPILTAFIALTIISAVWSAAPGITLRRAVGLLGTGSFGAYLACRFTPHEVLRMTGAAFAAVVCLSILVIIFVPSYGTAEGREIAGVFGQKNELGRAMIFAILALWALVRDPESGHPVWALPALLAALALLALSRSAQAIVGLAAAIVVAMPLLVVCARHFTKVNVRLATVLLIMIALLAFIVSAFAEELLEVLGRDATLTNRTLIWELLIEFAQERPWLGRGYGAFWFTDVSLWFADRWGALDHAHNGYMDLWLELGYIGVASFILLLLTASKNAWNSYLIRPTAARSFFPTFIFIAALVNCVGRLIPAHNSIYWVILCYCALMHLSVQRSDRFVYIHPRPPMQN